MSVVISGIRYTAPNDNGRSAYIIAADEKTGKRLFRAMLFSNRIVPNLEDDVQWVFIAELREHQGKLLARSEKNDCYVLDGAAAQSGMKVDCPPVNPPLKEK